MLPEVGKSHVDLIKNAKRLIVFCEHKIREEPQFVDIKSLKIVSSEKQVVAVSLRISVANPSRKRFTR